MDSTGSVSSRGSSVEPQPKASPKQTEQPEPKQASAQDVPEESQARAPEQSGQKVNIEA